MINRSLTALRRGAAALALAAGLAIGLTSAASALPPDGAGPDSPGTSSSVWPSEVKAGETLNFKVSGYPAGETVYIKIDDGEMCTDTSHGACVYHTQKLDKNGSATGSIVVPDLEPGKHWLRMLATGDVFDEETGEKLGYEGYTRRGGNDFTVVAGGSSDKSAGGSDEVKGGGSTKSDGKVTGGSVTVDLGDDESASPSPEASASASESASVDPSTEPTASVDAAQATPTSSPEAAVVDAAQAPPGAAGGVPVAGIAILAGAVVVGGGAVAWALARRNRLTKLAAATAGQG